MDLTAPPQSDPLDLALQRELQPGERVLWQGRPIPRLMMKAFAIYLFAVPWTAFSLFWTVMAGGAAMAGWSRIGAWGVVGPLFGLPFIVVGLGMLAVPFVPLFIGNRVSFAITDRRLLRFVLAGRLRTQSVPGNSIGQFDRSERPDGSGTLSIAIGTWVDTDGDQRTRKFDIGEVADVMAVERHLRAMQDTVRRSAVSS